ncbi:MAG: hypothetical protein K5799_05175 [Erythrobacter sp.]|nr:hypothetical protein [Erythrobacter sp.]
MAAAACSRHFNICFTTDELRAKRSIDAEHGMPKRRIPMLGTLARGPNLKSKICRDEKQLDGPVINFEPGYPAKEFDGVRGAPLSFHTAEDAASPPKL